MDAGLWIGGQLVPLTRLHVKARVLGFSARVTVSLKYVLAEGAVPSSALFKASIRPSLTIGAICGFEVTVDDNTTTAHVQEREKVIKAVEQEKLNTFLENRYKEILLCKVEQIASNMEVKITYLTELSYLSATSSQLLLPTSIVWERQNAERTRYDISLDADLEMPSPIHTVASPTHPSVSCAVTKEDVRRATAQLVPTPHAPTTPLALVVSLAPVSAPPHVFFAFERGMSATAGDSSKKTGDSARCAGMVVLQPVAATQKGPVVSWGCGGEDVVQTPSVPVPSENRVVLFGFFEGVESGANTVSIVDVSPPIVTDGELKDGTTDGDLIHVLAANSRVQELGRSGDSAGSAPLLTELGLQYDLSTSRTSFLVNTPSIFLLSSAPEFNPLESDSQNVTSPNGREETPLSPPSRKIYDTKFLLQFKPLCVDMPDGLPPIEVILGKGIMPQPATHGRSSKPPRKSSSGRGGRRDGSSRDTTKDRLATLASTLEANPNKWVPPNAVKQATPFEELSRKAIGLLNKITPENFAVVGPKIAALKVTSSEELTEIVSQLSEKALSEPNYCRVYADLALNLSVEYPSFKVDGQEHSFKRFLLNRCQKEFERLPPPKEDYPEKADYDDVEFKYRKRALGNIRFIGELFKKGMLPESIVQHCIARLLKMRTPDETPREEDLESLCKMLTTLGAPLERKSANSKTSMDTYFTRIAALSKDKQLPSRIRFMLDETVALRKNGWVPRRTDNAPTTIAAVHADAEREERRNTEEIISLRNSTPGLRNSQTGVSRPSPHKGGAAAAPVAPAPSAAILPTPEKPVPDRKNSLKSSDGVPKNKEVSLKTSEGISKNSKPASNGWAVVAPPARGARKELSFDAKDAKQPQDGARGRGAGRPNPKQAADSADSFHHKTDAGGFGLLASPNGRPSGGNRGGNSGGRGGAANKGGHPEGAPAGRGAGKNQAQAVSTHGAMANGHERAPANNRTSGKSEGAAVRQNGKGKGDAQAAGERSGNSSLDEDSTGRADTPADDDSDSEESLGLSDSSEGSAYRSGPLTADQLSMRTDALLQEYLYAGDQDEALTSVRELNAPASFPPQFITKAVLIAVERKPIDVDKMRSLLRSLAAGAETAEGHIQFPRNDFSTGFKEVLELIEDLDIDIPMASKHLAAFIGDAIGCGTLPLSFLADSLENLVSSGKAETVAVVSMQAASVQMGEAKFADAFRSSGFDIKSLLKKDRKTDSYVDELFKSKNLTFLAA